MERQSWLKRVWANWHKRWALIATVAYIALALTVTVLNIMPGLFVDRQFLIRRGGAQVGDGQCWISMTRTADGAEFAYRFFTDERSAHMAVDPDDTLHFAFGDGTTMTGKWVSTPLGRYEFVLGEAFPDTGYVSYGRDAARPEYNPRRESLAAAMYHLYTGEFVMRGFNWKQTLLSAGLYVLALVIWLWPREMMTNRVRWRFKGDPELSDEGRYAARAYAGLAAVAAFVALFIQV